MTTRKWFTGNYVAGIVIGFAPVWLAYTNGLDFMVAGFKALVLAFGFNLVHIVLLFLHGVFIPKPRAAVIGDRIQTAGYIHTLTGFIVAVTLFGKGHSSMDDLMVAIGVSLSASLLGWFLGSLLDDPLDTDALHASLKSEADRLAAELGGFATAVRDLQVRYLETLGASVTALQEINRQQERLAGTAKANVETLKHRSEEILKGTLAAISPIHDTVKEIREALDRTAASLSRHMGTDFATSLELLRGRVDKLGQQIETISNTSSSITEFLSQGRLLLEELERLMKAVTKATKK